MAAAVSLLALLLLGLLLRATSRDEARPRTAPSPPTSTTTSTTPTTTTAGPTTSLLQALPALRIAAPNGIPPYDREAQFGQTWTDDDHDCQDTRTEVLIAQSRRPASLSPDGCSVVGGDWLDPWSGVITTTPGTLDIDHTVALANAWRSGASAWSPDRRLAFANDLTNTGHLIAIPAAENRAKSDDGPEDWRPPDRSSWCRYALNWAAIKQRWDLSATPVEWSALTEIATTC